MSNIWIVVPVIKNDTDLSAFVNKLSGGYTAPEKYTRKAIDEETRSFVDKEFDHPHFGDTSPNFSGKIIFINKEESYQTFDGVTNIEDFGEINIYRYWNTGISHAISNGADAVVLVNGVVDFDPFIITDAYEKMVSENKEVANMSDGGMIMISSSCEDRMDEQFQIWYGDNDFYNRVAEKTTYSKPSYTNFDYLFDHVQDETFASIVNSDEAKFNAKLG